MPIVNAWLMVGASALHLVHHSDHTALSSNCPKILIICRDAAFCWEHCDALFMFYFIILRIFWILEQTRNTILALEEQREAGEASFPPQCLENWLSNWFLVLYTSHEPALCFVCAERSWTPLAPKIGDETACRGRIETVRHGHSRLPCDTPNWTVNCL